MIATLNSLIVYALFITLLVMGLAIDSAPAKAALAAGDYNYLPVYMLSYAIPNVFGLAVLSVKIRKLHEKNETSILVLWQESIVGGLIIATLTVFGGTMMNGDQILNANQETYVKLAGIVTVAAFKGQAILEAMEKK
jgi:hypothetical protein